MRFYFLIFALFVSAFTFGQNSESANQSLINTVRNNTVTPAKVANALDAVNYSKVSIVGVFTASGTDTYTATVNAGVTSYVSGQVFDVKFTNANTGASTLNINSLGAKSIKKNVSAALVAGDLIAGGIYRVAYDGTNFQVVGAVGSGGGIGDALVANPLSQFAATSSSQLRGVLSDETGTGVAVFNDSPAFTNNPTAPTQSPGNNSTRLATTAYVDASVVNPMTTQGDIIVGGASGALSRLGIGSAYDLVRVNSGATSPQYFSLTTGSVPFWSSTGLTQDNSTFFWDNTNKRLGIGLNTPSSKIEVQTNSLGVTQTSTSGIALSNTTAAAALNQQISPAIRFSSNGWGTTAGTSQDVSFRIYSLPVQGTTPTGSLVFERSTSGGAYASVGTISSAGVASFPNFNASSAVASNDFNRLSNAVMNISPSNIHSGVGINFQYVSAANSIQTSGNQIYAQFTGGFFPTSGTATWQTIRINNTITMSGGANGSVKFINIDPAITAAGGDVAGITYDPTITTISGNNYGLRIIPTTSYNGFGLSAPTATLHVVGTMKFDGSVTLPTAGNGLLIKEGTNATMGVATLSAGTVTVNTTKVTANSRIMLTVQSLGTVSVPTMVGVTARTAGTSFTITSASGTDTSVIAWTILEPAP